NNFIAVEIHQFVVNSSDLSFDLRLTGLETPPPTNVTIFPLNSVWKYLDNGTNQGTAWRDVAFSDATWASGPGEFGYGDGDESTVVSYGSNASNKFITTYFRKTISIADISAFTSMQLGIKRDDGVVVYVNGVEVWRDNINGVVTYTTLAANDAADDGSSLLTANIPTSYFVNGTNVIAVEIHQFVANSSDLSFDMSLTGMGNTPPAIPSVVIGSYLNVATPTSIIVRYRTDISAMSKIVYGTTSGIFTDSAVSASPVTEHIVQLSGLQPNTKYYYAVKSGNNFLQNDPAENYFITPPVAGTVKPTRIWVLGDMGLRSVWLLLMKEKPRLL
ncbi:MAG TPA: fibronectin type III domain-containing protein, partial [Bacteroidia bacterium]|nr:fibronectin type III domain-containing protein [Bacteroidia bacterium]